MLLLRPSGTWCPRVLLTQTLFTALARLTPCARWSETAISCTHTPLCSLCIPLRIAGEEHRHGIFSPGTGVDIASRLRERSSKIELRPSAWAQLLRSYPVNKVGLPTAVQGYALRFHKSYAMSNTTTTTHTKGQGGRLSIPPRKVHIRTPRSSSLSRPPASP